MLNTFGDKVTFLSPKYHSAQIVISRKCFQEQSLSSFINDVKPEILLEKAANCLRNSVIEHSNNIGKLSWPPPVDEFGDKQRDPPMSLLKFLCCLLFGNNSRNTISEHKWKIVRSIADDLV